MHDKSPCKKFYVYRITNVKSRKHYYGYKSIDVDADPKQHLGKIYFSSSTDKEFIDDQKNNPKSYRYKIIKIYDNKDDALKHEIKLHERFDVAKNLSFYNKARQTSTKFAYYEGRTKNKGMTTVRDINTGQIFQIHKDNFDPSKHCGITKGRVLAKSIVDGKVIMASIDDIKSGRAVGFHKGFVIALNTTTNQKERITKEMFDSSDTYVGHSAGHIITDETREKLRKSRKGNRNGAGNRGKPKSPQHIANVVAAKLANKIKRLTELQNL